MMADNGMVRLTEWDESAGASIIGVDIDDMLARIPVNQIGLVTDAINRLAAYEETGLTPEEVQERVGPADSKDKGFALCLGCAVHMDVQLVSWCENGERCEHCGQRLYRVGRYVPRLRREGGAHGG